MQEHARLLPLSELLEHPWLNTRNCLSFGAGAGSISVKTTELPASGALSFSFALPDALLMLPPLRLLIPCLLVLLLPSPPLAVDTASFPRGLASSPGQPLLLEHHLWCMQGTRPFEAA